MAYELCLLLIRDIPNVSGTASLTRHSSHASRSFYPPSKTSVACANALTSSVSMV